MIKHLVAEGHSVVGAVRDAKVSGENVAALGAKVVEVGSLADAAALQAAFAGVDGVFHMAAVHPQYGFEAGDRDAILKTAVDGTTSVIAAAKAAGVGRIVVTSSLAAIECGNDEGVLTEATWSRPEVYDSSEKLTKTQWATHYTYVKSKVEQEKAAVAFAAEHGLDLRVVVPGNLCVGPIASKEINGTMTRLKDIVSGTNTLKGAADLCGRHYPSGEPLKDNVASVLLSGAAVMLDVYGTCKLAEKPANPMLLESVGQQGCTELTAPIAGHVEIRPVDRVEL